MALSRDGNPLTVYLDGEEVTYLVPIEIVRSSGGSRLDYARFEYNLAQTGERVENLRTPVAFEKLVRVDAGKWNETTEAYDYTTIFRGWLHRQDVQVDTGERVIVTASILPQDFGLPIEGMALYDKRRDANGDVPNFILTGDILFNPNIDGVIEGNMSSFSIPEWGDMQVWCDPESVRTTEAEAYRGESASEWALSEAIHSVSQLHTPYAGILPPDVRGSVEIDDEAMPLHNVRIPFGATLPQALDLLTHPFGYDWWVDPTETAESDQIGKIIVYRRGTGPEKTVTMQAVGGTLDISDAEGATNCHGFRLSVDIGGRVNKLRLVGSRKQWELGIELYRGWATADDALTAYDLDKSNPDSDYYTANKRDVWRLFVANEAGDYSGLRDSGAQTIPAAPRDWSLYGVLYDKRRRAEDCLTFGPDMFRLPPQLEWSRDDGANWEPVGDRWGWRPLETQIGIRFDGPFPPEELMSAGDDAKVRLCCTITGDECIEAKVAVDGRNAESVGEPGDVWQVIDVSDRYHYRQVNVLGDNKSFVYDVSMDADQHDDTEALNTAAEYLLKEIDGADINGDIRLVGIRTDYEIGDLLTSIEGRNIDLNRRAVDPESGEIEPGEARYLQVMGVRWLFGGVQETHLATRPQHVDPWYQPGARPDGVV